MMPSSRAITGLVLVSKKPDGYSIVIRLPIIKEEIVVKLTMHDTDFIPETR